MSYVEDRLAIYDLFVRYTIALDTGDVETIVGCFYRRRSLDSPTVGTYSGALRSANSLAALPGSENAARSCGT